MIHGSCQLANLNMATLIIISSFLSPALGYVPAMNRLPVLRTTRGLDGRAMTYLPQGSVVPFAKDPRFQFDGDNALDVSGLNLAPIVLFAILVLFPGFIFKVLNGILVLSLLLPPILTFAFQQWSKRNLISAPCPRCTAPISSLKDSPTLCFNCGAPLVPTTKGDTWRLRSVYDDAEPDFSGPFAQRSRTRKTTSSSVIDVEADVE